MSRSIPIKKAMKISKLKKDWQEVYRKFRYRNENNQLLYLLRNLSVNQNQKIKQNKEEKQKQRRKNKKQEIIDKRRFQKIQPSSSSSSSICNIL